MKPVSRQLLTYGFPVLCLLALAAAFLTFRAPRSETKEIHEGVAFLADIDLKDPLDAILQAFQRRYAIRVSPRYETEEDLWETFARSEAFDVLLTARHARFTAGNERERIRSTRMIARRAGRPLNNAGKTEIINLHLLDGAASPEMLNEFVRFVMGASAGEILARHGYTPAEPANSE